MTDVVASTRDALWLRSPRHDGPGGHRPGSWAPKWHVVIDHPTKGGSWSACGKVFLLAGGEDASLVPSYSRCQLNGCKQRWPEAGGEDDTP